MVRENGCEPAWRYPHKGVLGNLLGLDLIQAVRNSAKNGSMLEDNRLRNWSSGRYTISTRSLTKECEYDGLN